jgi:hypothetical protein
VTQLQFLVKWLGCGVEHNTWEPEANRANCTEKVSEYWSAVQSQSGMRLVSTNTAQRKKQRKKKRTSHAAALPAAAAVATRSKRRRT